MELDDKSLHVLSCDIAIRPSAAAGIAELVPFVRIAKNDGAKVIVHFDIAGKDVVESFVRAERLCCTGLTWELVASETLLQLTVTGTTEQVSIVNKWFDPA
jgi:hypothetical protein